MKKTALQELLFSTYLTLRYAIAITGALLPLLVYGVGAAKGVPLQDSISAYYWASPHGQNAPSRDWLVGSIFAVAGFLYLYKGFSKAENVLLNTAAVCAVGAAVFPMEWHCEPNCGKFSFHGFFAVSMFTLLAFVVWFRARDTLSLLPKDAKPSSAAYRRTYQVIGFVMLASPLTAFILSSLIGARSSYIFFIEAAGIWAFALYWWVKSSELKQSAATELALHAEVETASGRSSGPLTYTPSDDHLDEKKGEE